MDQAPKIENEVVERELSSEEKKTLADAWFNLVLGRKNDSTDVEGFDNEQMRAWLYDSLISETLVLRNEWGINPDIEKYQEALDAVDKEDFTKKGNVQFRFIDFLNDKIVDFDTSHPKGLGRPRRWESWPKTMRESKNFNCVGATLFAIASHCSRFGASLLVCNPLPLSIGKTIIVFAKHHKHIRESPQCRCSLVRFIHFSVLL
jgi:hypothetical protein